MLHPNTVLWNVMFKGYNETGLHADTLNLFACMRRRGVRPNGFTFTFVVKSCGRMSKWSEGEQAHCCAVKTGHELNRFLGTTLIDMYASVGLIEYARKVFVEMPDRNVVAWTAIVAAYVSTGDLETARVVFDWAVERDAILWNTMISGYIERGRMAAARELFDCMPERDRDVITWNTILLGYTKEGNLAACKRLFDEMPERNVFSWNGLIGGYLSHEKFIEVLGVFHLMLRSLNVVPNDVTLVAVLSACSKLGVINLGRWIHAFTETIGFKGNVYIANGLIDMYSKCGCISDAMSVFQRMEVKDLISWNTMIGGLATHGRGAEALELFEQMLKEGERPDGISFVGALSACVHMGMVEKGFTYFRLMVQDYSITSWIEHYGCMMDLLGRAGLLKEAVKFLSNMPMKPDAVIWSALLGACQVHKHISLAKLVMNKMIKLEPEDVTNYVVFSNIYGAAGRWKEVAKLKMMLRNNKGEAKLSGCSLVEVDAHFVEFCSSDTRHSQTLEIYQALHGLKRILKFVRYEQELDEVCAENNARNQCYLCHVF